MTSSLYGVRAHKYRKFPRAYDLGKIARYLTVLHESPIPLREIEERKLESSMAAGRVTQEIGEAVRRWKRERGLESSDESEYRYLMRDLGIIHERDVDPEIEREIPIGGDGPTIGTLVPLSSREGLYFLSRVGEILYSFCVEDKPSYQAMLFWLILRNQSYLPLIQQVIVARESYIGKDLADVMQTNDSTSLNCALNWLRYFGIAKCAKSKSSAQDNFNLRPKSTCRLETANLATYLLGAAILEIGETLSINEDYYVKEIDRHLNEKFSLNPSATDFVAAIDLIFRYSRPLVKGYSSSRGDATLPNFPRISIVRFTGKIPLTLLTKVSREEELKITRYAR
jgi:hypothetical protein